MPQSYYDSYDEGGHNINTINKYHNLIILILFKNDFIL